MWLVFVLSLFCCCCCSTHVTAALTQYNHLSSGNIGTSALGTMTTATTFAATDSRNWQPISNNWLILQTSAGLQAYDSNRSSMKQNQLHQLHQQKHHPQQPYGRHDTVVTPQHKVFEPYILSFSKIPTQDVSKRAFFAQQVADSFYDNKQQRLAVNEGSVVLTPSTTTTTVGTKEPPQSQAAQDIGNIKLKLDVRAPSSSFSLSSSSTPLSSSSVPSSSAPSSSVPSSSLSSSSPTILRATVSQQQSSKKRAATATDTGVQIIHDTDVEQRLNDLLLPYENVFANVKYLFYVVKNIIGVSEADAFDWPKSRKLHGDKAVSTTKTTFSVGTSRKAKKLKKKLKKFMLPLLLAYKLKFLMLIPLLFGGLILLVGTTGLAGFFFALFTAVMSLKTSGDAKSLVVKKIH